LSGFVVFKDHDGWFKVTFGHWWDDPRHWMDGERIDTRLLIERFAERRDAEALRLTYNMMVHRRAHKHANKWDKEKS